MIRLRMSSAVSLGCAGRSRTKRLFHTAIGRARASRSWAIFHSRNTIGNCWPMHGELPQVGWDQADAFKDDGDDARLGRERPTGSRPEANTTKLGGTPSPRSWPTSVFW